MKAYVVFSSKEPVLIVTRHTIRNEVVLAQLARVGIRKFIAREVPIEHIRGQYGPQFDVIEDALKRGGKLRVLDFNGRRIFENLPFSEFGPAYRHDRSMKEDKPTRGTSRPTLRPQPGADSPPFFG